MSPSVRGPGSSDPYPLAAKRSGDQGVVDLEFSIDRQGHPQDVRETVSASKDLNEGALELLKKAVFLVGPDWDDAHEHARLAIEVQFGLSGDNGRCAVGEPPRTLGALLVTLCGSPLHPERRPLSR